MTDAQYPANSLNDTSSDLSVSSAATAFEAWIDVHVTASWVVVLHLNSALASYNRKRNVNRNNRGSQVFRYFVVCGHDHGGLTPVAFAQEFNIAVEPPGT